VPGVFDALGQYVVGGLQPGETVLRVACLRNPRPDGTTAAAITVLTDRAVLLAEEDVPGQRIARSDISHARGVDSTTAAPTTRHSTCSTQERTAASSRHPSTGGTTNWRARTCRRS
jgi:hypothetical protein